MKPSWLSRSLLITTALVLPGAAFAQDAGPTDPPVAADDAATPDEGPEQADVSMGGDIIVTGRARRDETRSSDQVLSVLSTEDIARTGEGDIAGALSRVTGLSVVGNGFVYVRGLGDRYSLALLNGLPLPSPEPLRRVIPLDLFPTNVIASSQVQKSYSANYPGEFGGGVINLTTIAVPEESFLSIGVSGGANTETTGHFGYSYYGTGTDWTGFDNSARDVPPNLNAFFASGNRLSESETAFAPIIAELVRPNFVITQKLDQVPANWGASLTGGTVFDVGDARVGVIATASYSNDWRTRDIIQQTPEREDLTVLNQDGRTVNTENNIRVNAMLGLGVEIGEHRFRATQLYIRDTIKQTRLGEALDNNSGFDRITQDTAWFERQLIDSQFVGELRFGDLGIDLRASYANSQREAPFETSFLYTRNNIPGNPFEDLPLNRLDNGANGAANIAFSDLNEDQWYGGIDLSFLATDRFGIAVGYAYTDTFRKSARREFTITAPQITPTAIFAFRPDLLIREPLISGGICVALGQPQQNCAYNLFELTEGSPAFAAALEIHGAYAKINWEIFDYVTLDAGVRYETADQLVRTMDVFHNPVTAPFSNTLSNEYWLPGVTLTWEASSDFQLRLNASKTIARPQFRELLPILYYDPESNRSFRGNPLLEDSELFNAEVRAEYFLGADERITLAGFYKKIDKPIEVSINFASNGTVGNFANAPEADLYGGEVELVKYFNLYDWGGFFSDRRFFTIANYTYTNSKLNVTDEDFVFRFGLPPLPADQMFIDGSPLTGQSDHLANLQFGLENTEKLSQQTILVKYASERVIGRGDGQFPDILERPGIQIDLVWREGINLFGIETEWEFEARNILGENYEEFQATEDNRIEVNTYDIGTTFSLGVSAKF
jgi:outer membrane receptor protein involved in Fe transport